MKKLLILLFIPLLGIGQVYQPAYYSGNGIGAYKDGFVNSPNYYLYTSPASTAAAPDVILLEDGNMILTEDGKFILLENSPTSYYESQRLKDFDYLYTEFKTNLYLKEETVNEKDTNIFAFIRKRNWLFAE